MDLVAEPFDMAIRIGKLEDSSLITRLIGRHSRHLYASPGYIEASGEHAQQRRRPSGQPPGRRTAPEKIAAENLAHGRSDALCPKGGSSVSIYAVTEPRLIPAMTQRCINFLSSSLMEA